MNKRYYALQDFFLGWYHPDWFLEHPSHSEVLDDFFASDSDLGPAVVSEIREILSLPLSEQELHDFVMRDYSLSYDPWRDEIPMREFLDGLACDLSQRMEGPTAR